MKFQVNTEKMAEEFDMDHSRLVDFFTGAWPGDNSLDTAIVCYVTEQYLAHQKTERPDTYAIGQQWANGKDKKETVWQVDNVLDSGEALCSKVRGDFTKDNYRIFPAKVSTAYRFLGMATVTISAEVPEHRA